MEETTTRAVVQELLEGEQSDFLGAGGRYDRHGEEHVGSRNGHQRGRRRTTEALIDVAVPEIPGAAGLFPFSPSRLRRCHAAVSLWSEPGIAAAMGWFDLT